MAKQALVMQINEALDDPNLELPILGCMSFDFYQQGDGTGTSYITIGVTKATVIQIAGGVLMNIAGNDLGSSYTLPVGRTDLKIKATQANGKILIRDSANIDRIGSTVYGIFKPDSTANSPYAKIDVSQLPSNLTVIDGTTDSNVVYTGNLARTLTRMNLLTYASFKGLESRMFGDTRTMTYPTSFVGFSYQVKNDNSSFIFSIDKIKPSQSINLRSGQLYGNLSSIKTTVSEYNIAGDVKDFTTGNIATIPTSVQTLIIQTASGLTYTGTRVWNNNTPYFIITGNVVFDSTTVDNILKDAANATFPNGGLISLKGSRSVASDGYVATLQAKAVSVQIANV